MADGASIGSVSVTVNPDASAFWSKFQAQAGAGASRVGDQLGATVGKSIQNAIAKGVVDGIQNGGRSAATSAAKAGDDAGGKFADLFRKRVEAALKSLPDAKIGADTSEADRRIAEIRTRLAELSGKSIGVNLDAGAALAEINALQGELRNLGAQSPNVQVRADVGAAAGELAGLEFEVAKLDGRVVNIQANADTAGATAGLSSLDGAALGSTSGIQALIAAGIAIAPAIVPAAAAAAAAIGAIGVAASVGGAGLGVLALGIVPVVGAVKALSDAHDAAGKSAASSAGKQGQMAAAIDGVKSAQAGLANASANAADAERRSAEQVANAQRSLTDAKINAERANEQSVQAVAAAEQTRTRAQRDALQAQKDLTQAAQDAKRANEDLANQVVDNGFAQQRATLAVHDAQQKLNATLGNPQTTARQRQEAQLTFDEAKQQLLEIGQQGQRLAADKAAADAKGIAGSKQVVAATAQVQNSQQTLSAAERGVAKAREDAANTARTSAESVAKAQQAVGDAVAAQASQARQSAFSIAQAQQGVVNAQRAVQQASISAGSTGSASMLKLQQAMAGLSPAGQAFAKFLFGLKGQFTDLSKVAQDGLLPGLQAGMVALLPLMPQVTGLVGLLARTMGDLFAQAGPVIAQILPPFLTMLGQAGPPIMQAFTTILLSLVRGFAGLAEAFAPFAVQFFQGLADLSTKFADFATGLSTNPGFQAFIDYVNANGPTLISLLGALAVLSIKLLIGFAPLGEIMLKGATAVAQFLAAMPPGVLLGIAYAIGLIVVSIAAIVGGPITAAVAVITIFAAAWVYAYTKVQWFHDLVNAYVTAIVAVVTWLWQTAVAVFNGIAGVVSAVWAGFLLPVFTAIWGFVQNVLGPVFLWLWGHVIAPAFDGIKLAIEIAWAVIQVIFGLIVIFIKAVLAPVFTWLWHNIIEPVWNGISAAISWTWENVLKPVFSALGGFIRDFVVPAFKTAVEAIGRAWDGLRDLARKPVEFVVKQVINPLIRGYDGLAKTFGAPHVDEIPGFAYGGFVSGPGGPRDDKIPAWLSNGEYVIPAGVVARHGVGFFDQLTGNTSRGGAGSGTFADGGFVGFFKDVWSGLSDPIGLLRKPAEALLNSIPGGEAIRGLLSGMGHKLIDGLLHFVGGHATGPGGKANPAAIGGPPGNSIAAIIRLAAISGLPYSVTSTYRPGDPGYHGRGMAVDFGDFQYGAAANNRLAAYFMRAAPDLLELIHSPGYYVKNGQQVGQGYYGPATVAAHYNHVHVAATPGGAAMASTLLGGPSSASHGLASGGLVGTATYDSGGFLPPGLTLAYNGTGSPETIRTADQEAALRRGGATITQHIYPQRGQSEPEIAAAASRQLAWELR